MAAIGVTTLIVTNSVGAINNAYKPGNIVMISDHINLMGDNPLLGSNDFVDLTEAYSIELINLTQETANKLGIALQSGVYVGCSGPCYETPAEIKAIRCMGGDLVGMSTVPEVIMANSLGMKVLGLSVITNMAAGINAKPLSHQDVIDTSKKASPKFSALAKGVIEQLQ
jgi:purine-nucleoside phosphorylase